VTTFGNIRQRVVKLAAPGMGPDNFEITAEQNMLTIHGSTQEEGEKQAVDALLIGQHGRSAIVPPPGAPPCLPQPGGTGLGAIVETHI
jgi:hypothetical protein